MSRTEDGNMEVDNRFYPDQLISCFKGKHIATTKRPYAQPNAQRRSIYTDDETWAKLKAMGKGNASAGIREAVRNATTKGEK